METEALTKGKTRTQKKAPLTEDEKRHRKQDETLKTFFSYPRVVKDLITGFVPESWVCDLDFTTLKKENVNHTSANNRSRESDIIWSVRGGKRLFIFLLIEFLFYN